MKKSGFRAVWHIYLLFSASLLGAILAAACLLSLLIAVRLPDGSVVRSDWPKAFAEDFESQIVLIDGAPRVRQAGLALLRDNGVGLQVLDPSGADVYHYNRPPQAKAAYSSADLLRLSQTDGPGQSAVFAGTAACGGQTYAYLLYFPVQISKVTMYLNGQAFAGGKAAILSIAGILLLAVLLSGALYGFWTARSVARLAASVQAVASRRYRPSERRGAFHDLYGSLNALDAELRASDRLQRETERMREDWIANITHDLKTPLSPIKGYAEILLEGGVSQAQCRRYAAVMLKNVSYLETLTDDLKLTYQLDNGMLPINRQEKDIVRFLKELAIDLLNTPEYENRSVHFENGAETVPLSFDETLMTRAFRNLIANAFVHGKADTAVTLRIRAAERAVRIVVADHGDGLPPEAQARLFDRYYRGGRAEARPEGTGLGLAIAKSVMELHGGAIAVSSAPGEGTAFIITLPRA